MDVALELGAGLIDANPCDEDSFGGRGREGGQQAAWVGGPQLVDLDAEALQKRLLELERQLRAVDRVDRPGHVGELVIGLKGDPGHAPRRQGLDHPGPHRGRLRLDRLDISPGGLGRFQRCRDRIVGGTPVETADPAGVEPGERRLDIGRGPGRAEGQHADRVRAGKSLPGECHEAVIRLAGVLSGGDADGAVFQRQGDALGEAEVAFLPFGIRDRRWRGHVGHVRDRLGDGSGHPFQGRQVDGLDGVVI